MDIGFLLSTSVQEILKDVVKGPIVVGGNISVEKLRKPR
jgi:hypothetical protein